MLLLHIAYSEKDAAAHIQFAFGQSSHAACLYVFEIHRKNHTRHRVKLRRIFQRFISDVSFSIQDRPNRISNQTKD